MLVVHELHALDLKIGREGAEMRAKQREIHAKPVKIAPGELGLHMGTKVISVDVVSEHGVEVARQNKTIEGDRAFHRS